MKSEFPSYKDKHIAVVGGGVAGATAAIHFAELGFKVSVIEKGVSLVNGPPICHLHAGGNLYREISEQQCLDLLAQSIDTVRLYPLS
ncbi:FAD-dependent oxidoreductase, partial [Vibrio parahaemolyticus]|nr:FAD-dependent oxidoreductase [Vibrio parahaemolyticus]